MNADLFNADMPFNLAGESLNAEFDAQAEANEKRVRELAAEEARKAQYHLTLDARFAAADRRTREVFENAKRGRP